MNKNKQVSHSKQTIRVIFTHPSPQSLCSPKYSATNLTQPLRVKTLLITSSTISQFWFLKLTKRFKFNFCFCLKLRYKAFLTILVNIYNIYFFYLVIYNEHIPQDIPLSVLSRGRNSLTLTLQILL